MTTGAAFAFVDSLHDTAVRDLGWLLASPSLLTAVPGAPLAQPWPDAAGRSTVEAWLTALDAQPEPLHRALDGFRPTRLGRYAECLLEYFLTHGPSLRLVAANLPLRSNGKTLGEVDFLVDAPDGQRLHWELAVKCYLCAPVRDGASLADFVGPNLVDRFDRKRSRLLDHQLRLAEHDGFARLAMAHRPMRRCSSRAGCSIRTARRCRRFQRKSPGSPAWILADARAVAGVGGLAACRRRMERVAEAGLARAATGSRRYRIRTRAAGGRFGTAARVDDARGAGADRRA